MKHLRILDPEDSSKVLGLLEMEEEAESSLAELEEAKTKLTSYEEELAKLEEVKAKFAEQIGSAEGFAELGKEAGIWQDDASFIEFAVKAGYGHLFGKLEEPGENLESDGESEGNDESPSKPPEEPPEPDWEKEKLTAIINAAEE